MRSTILAVGLCLSSLTLWADESAQNRLADATSVFHDIMATPEKGIPSDLLDRASCAVIVPGLKKGAFIVGAKYGKGFVTCRRPSGRREWSDPAAITVEGGSFGFQIGGSETDVVMLIMNKEGAEKLLTRSKFTVGADANVAAGPVGRSVSADTDAYMRAEILSWSRSRGLFAGVALQGATLRPDEDANRELYGQKLNSRQVVYGNYPMPAAAKPLIASLDKYSPVEEGTSNAEREANPPNKATRRQRK